ncbi:hypothetical protein DENSPDRAFT_90223 [Dentipellis sp. KUC8613]|nr:hypothetical protein DENSPDRAFT_90223 [Dentipellis sp. KUC8613]
MQRQRRSLRAWEVSQSVTNTAARVFWTLSHAVAIRASIFHLNILLETPANISYFVLASKQESALLNSRLNSQSHIAALLDVLIIRKVGHRVLVLQNGGVQSLPYGIHWQETRSHQGALCPPRHILFRYTSGPHIFCRLYISKERLGEPFETGLRFFSGARGPGPSSLEPDVIVSAIYTS